MLFILIAILYIVFVIFLCRTSAFKANIKINLTLLIITSICIVFGYFSISYSYEYYMPGISSSIPIAGMFSIMIASLLLVVLIIKLRLWSNRKEKKLENKKNKYMK